MKLMQSKKFGVLIIGLVVGLVVAACGGDDPTATPRPTSTPRPTVTPAAVATATPAAMMSEVPDFPEAKYGGTILRFKPSEGPTWDGHRERTENTHDIVDTMFDQIIMVNPHKQGELVGQLATDWDVSNDGTVYTFNLNRGVEFHNGNAFNAADVKFTLEDVILNPPEGIIGVFAGVLAAIDTVTTPDDNTVIITLKERDASFLASIGSGRIHMFDKEFIEAEGRERMTEWPAIGTGPFLGKEGGHIPGVSVEVFKNPNYFVEGRPFLDGMKFFFIPDTGTQLAAFLTGQVTFDYRPNVTEREEIIDALGDKVVIQETPSLTWWGIVMNSRVEPYNDLRVRKAVAYAMDKRAVIEVVRQGLGVLGGIVPPGTGFELPMEELLTFAGYSPDREANIAKAKELLTEAGFPNGFDATFFVRNHPAYQDPAVVMQASLREVGIRVTLNVVEQAVFFADRREPTTQMTPAGHRYVGTDPNFMFREFHLPNDAGGARNDAGVSDQKTIDLFNAQNREVDPVKRKQIVNELERHVLGLYAEPIAYYSVVLYARYSNIKNFFVHTSYAANQQFRDVWIEQ